MAVFTPISRKQCLSFLTPYDVGRLESIDETFGGTQNTNYILNCRKEDARQQRYILTLFEQEPSTEDLNFFLHSMQWMSERQIPAPRPVTDQSDNFLGMIENRPAALSTFLPGEAVAEAEITTDHCRSVGTLIARMHQAGKNFPQQRANDFPLQQWESMYHALQPHAQRINQDTKAAIRRGLDRLQKDWPLSLESGFIHADIFPDNVFFQESDIHGIIDFYYACTDFFAYDVMVAVNAWCFDNQHDFHPARYRAMMNGYRKHRALTGQEESRLSILGAGAAMRFLLTRLRDRLAPPNARHFSDKDPHQYQDILVFHLNQIDDKQSRKGKT